MAIKQCVVCGTQFNAFRGVRTCSLEHARKRAIETNLRCSRVTNRRTSEKRRAARLALERPCEMCAETFLPLRKGQVACASDRCRAAYRAQKSREWRLKNPDKGHYLEYNRERRSKITAAVRALKELGIQI